MPRRLLQPHRLLHLLRSGRVVRVPATRTGVQRVPTKNILISQTYSLIGTTGSTLLETSVCFGTVRRRLAGLLLKRPVLGRITHLRKDINSRNQIIPVTSRSSLYNTSYFISRSSCVFLDDGNVEADTGCFRCLVTAYIMMSCIFPYCKFLFFFLLLLLSRFSGCKIDSCAHHCIGGDYR